MKTKAWAIVWKDKQQSDEEYELFTLDDENTEPAIYLTKEAAENVLNYMKLKVDKFYKIIQVTIH